MKASASVGIPAPTDDDKPFPIRDELTVYEAAMVHAGRYPYPRMFGPYDDESSRRERCLTLLKVGLKERRSWNRRGRPRGQRSLDIYCEIMERIKRGMIQPVKTAYDFDGEIDPSRTVIKTSELVKLAKERGEQPKYLKHLLKIRSGRATSEHDRDVIAHVANILKENPDISRDDALKECRNRFPKLSRSFFRTNIFPRAREALGWPPHAPSGPKPKRGRVPILEKPVVSQHQGRNGSQGHRQSRCRRSIFRTKAICQFCLR